jgi:hypothetical protein
MESHQLSFYSADADIQFYEGRCEPAMSQPVAQNDVIDIVTSEELRAVEEKAIDMQVQGEDRGCACYEFGAGLSVQLACYHIALSLYDLGMPCRTHTLGRSQRSITHIICNFKIQAGAACCYDILADPENHPRTSLKRWGLEEWGVAATLGQCFCGLASTQLPSKVAQQLNGMFIAGHACLVCCMCKALQSVRAAEATASHAL